MPEARINDNCIIGLPTCGYAFSSSRMAFVAAPSDDEFRLELDVLQGLLTAKEYEAYVAVQRVDPAKLAFCTKICSKIITSQFCLVLLNSSVHRDHSDIRIPNPNVHLEYGLMLAFKKYTLPFQREGDALAFNIRPLDTILYTNANFREKAERAIDGAILVAGTTSRPTRSIMSSEILPRYIALRGLHISPLVTPDANALYQLGSPMGFVFLEGREVVWFGLFDQEPAKEVVFRLKLLLQNVHTARTTFENETVRIMPAEQAEQYRRLWARLRIEVFVSRELDKERIRARVAELTGDLTPTPWEVLSEDDVQAAISKEFDNIGDL
jgi:hypothetical protein